MLLESFFESYGLIIILLAGFALIMLYYFLKNRKFQQTENDFQSSLKVGDKVKTYSGFYGVVEKITNTTDGKVVTLKLGENAYIDVDIRALMGIDQKQEVKEEPVAPQAEESKEIKAEEEKPAEKVEEKAEEKIEEQPAKEEVKEKPAKASTKKAEKPAKEPAKKPAKKSQK